MGLCKKKLNLTIIVKNFKNGNLFYIDEKFKKIAGIIGKEFNKLIDNSNGNCNLIDTDEFGVHNEINNTYNGGLQLLYEKKGDFLINHTPHLIKKDFFYHSHSTHVDDVSISHQIIDSNKGIEKFPIYTLDEIFVYLYYIIIAIYILVFLCLSKLIQGKKFKAIRLLENLFDFKFDYGKSIHKSMLKIAFQLILFKIFIAFYKTLINQSIKVKRVLVKTDNLITSIEQLFKTELQVCWFKDSEITNVAIHSPKDNILYRLYDRDKSCLNDLSSMNGLFNYKNRSVFVSNFYFEYFLSRFVELESNNIKYWMSSPVFEYIMVHFYRKGLNRDQIDVINKLSLDEIEHGLFTYINNLPLILFKQLNLNKPKIYSNINDYVSDNTVFCNIDLNFFNELFKLFFILQFLAYLIYLISFFFIRLRLKFKLQFYFKMFYRLCKLYWIKICRKLSTK